MFHLFIQMKHGEIHLILLWFKLLNKQKKSVIIINYVGFRKKIEKLTQNVIKKLASIEDKLE